MHGSTALYKRTGSVSMLEPASVELWHIGMALDSKCDCLWIRILFWTNFLYTIESELMLINQHKGNYLHMFFSLFRVLCK